jgi:murein L,D-transpeptidase YafK
VGGGVALALVLTLMAPRTIPDVLDRYGAPARARLQPHLAAAGLGAVRRVRLLAVKDERKLELWAAGADARLRYVRTWDVRAASGGPGPKLRQGDHQVPEGLYRLTVLNPSSRYHLSVRVDYPNAFDRARAREDGRKELGGDIYVHGNEVSVGCLALGDPTMEELFVLLADVGLRQAEILIVPSRTPQVPPGAPAWTADLYATIARELAAFRR